MKLNTVREGTKLGTTYTLYPLGDVHLGSANCDLDLFTRTLLRIREDEHARWIGIGDYCEWITVRDPRWAAGGIDESIINLANLDRIGDRYVEVISDLLRPVMAKCWGLGDGNHEQKFAEFHSTNLSMRILERAGADPGLYSGWAGMTRVVFEDTNNHRAATHIYHSHGWQGGRMSGAKVNQMEKLLAWIDADIYLHGHSHSRFIVPVDRLRTNHAFTKVKADKTYVAHTGSFLKTYQQDTVSYAERAGYPPTSLGTVRFHLTPTEKGVVIEGIQ